MTEGFDCFDWLQVWLPIEMRCVSHKLAIFWWKRCPIWESVKTGDGRIAKETLSKLPNEMRGFYHKSAIFWWKRCPIWESVKTGDGRIAKETVSKLPNETRCFYHITMYPELNPPLFGKRRFLIGKLNISRMPLIPPIKWIFKGGMESIF